GPNPSVGPQKGGGKRATGLRPAHRPRGPRVVPLSACPSSHPPRQCHRKRRLERLVVKRNRDSPSGVSSRSSKFLSTSDATPVNNTTSRAADGVTTAAAAASVHPRRTRTASGSETVFRG